MHNELNPIQTKDINAYYLLPTFGTELSLSPTMSHKCLLRAECILSRTSAAVDEWHSKTSQKTNVNCV